MSGVVAYTDGACSGNPGPGGWAWAVEDGPYRSGFADHTTNQRMEIQAALEAVRDNAGPLEIRSDSTYVVNCFRDAWYVGWRKKGWQNSQRKPVANKDLWEPLIDLVLERGDVTFTWVKGHNDDPMNDLVDRLAVQAITERRGRSGTGTPAGLGPADAPKPKARSSTGGGPRLPEGHLVLVAGLRPPQLGGYDPNPTSEAVQGKLSDAISFLSTEHPDLMVVTGMGLGAEQLGAQAALDAGVPFVAVLAHPNVEEVWTVDTRQRFQALLGKSLMEAVYDDRPPTSKQAAGAAASRRDAWLAKQASDALVVHDGEDDRTDRIVASLVMQLGDEHVLLIHP